jgi:hypothetical protein
MSGWETVSKQSGKIHTRGRFVRRREDAATAAVGLAILIAGMVAVRHGSVSGLERSTFRAINNLPGALYPVLWPFQQLGNLVVAPIVAVVAAYFRKFRPPARSSSRCWRSWRSSES